MSNVVKSKFAGLIRGLLGRRNVRFEAVPAGRSAVSSVEQPLPNPRQVQSPVAPAPVPENQNTGEIAIPIGPVVAALPMELRAKITSIPASGMTISLPVDSITSQLAFGVVRISFGELRQCVPGLFSHSGPEHDKKLVSIPLNEVLSRLNPAVLSRRSTSRVEVDSSIAGPFGSRNSALAFTTQPLKAPAARKPVEPAPYSAHPLPAYSLPPRVTQPAQSPLSAPIAFTPPSGLERPSPSAAVPVKPPTPPAPAEPLTLKISAAPVPPAAAPAAQRPEPAQQTILASLWDLAENWPGELKKEILSASLADENVPLPAAMVESGLKRGRVTMAWKQIRMLAKPSSAASVNDQLELELPLKVIAPLFFAIQSKAQPRQKQTVVSEEIPNLFFGFPQAAPQPAAPAAPAPERKAAESNFYIWGDTDDRPAMEAPVTDEAEYALPQVPQTDFASRQIQPKDVVARARSMPGVSGVVVALPDGLRVASDVPADLNADTLAAFIPQLFERMNQSARELRMGVLNNVSFTVGAVPWKIFRVNAVFVAAFGRAGEPLPTADLAALAAELDRKKNI